MLNAGAYAALVLDRLTGDRAARYSEALRSVRVEVVDALVQARVQQGRPIPGRLVDAADHSRRLTLTSAGDLEQDLSFTIISATSNAVQPLDIDVSTKDHRDAARTWSALGYAPRDGELIAESLVEAEQAFRAAPWRKYAVGAAGLALVAVAPIGLVAAAPVGLAGAAAITSSLAAFGPGGMLGGMLLAGGLIGTGSATAAIATASGLSADMLETAVVRRMATSLARRRIGLDDGESWRLFAFWHSELSTERAHHEPISDDDSPTVTSLQHKARVLSTALTWMSDHGLTPALGAADEVEDGARD